MADLAAVALADTLLEAIRRMGVRGTPVLPVLATQDHRLVGIVSRSHILAACERALTGSGPTARRPPVELAGGGVRGPHRTPASRFLLVCPHHAARACPPTRVSQP